MSEILTAKQIFKSYQMGQDRLEVLKGLDLSVNQGEFLAIIGASGCGKSTLLHILGALDKCDKGTVEYQLKDLKKFSSKQLNHFRNSQVGFVFQFYHLLDELSVLENVLLPAMAKVNTLHWLKTRFEAKKRAKMLLSMMDLTDKIKSRPYQLSGGQRQRVAIARALMNDPDLLLADEPTGNLDWRTGNGILEVLQNLNRSGQTIVMVTHDERIAAMAHRTIRLDDGKIVN